MPRSSSPKSDLPVVPFSSREAWAAWLEEHHDDSDGVWLKFARKSSGIASVTYPEAVEVALCYGWIDGQAAGFDDDYHLQRFTPRRARSRWSQINRAKATDLIERGLMKPAGLREVERAKADGRWDAAYAPPSDATVPDDLRAALEAEPEALATFDALSRSGRYAILYQVQDAKRPETRARRIAKFVAMLARGEKPY